MGTTSFSRTDSQVLLDINSANDININDINIILCTSTFEHEALHFLRMSLISFIFAAIIIISKAPPPNWSVYMRRLPILCSNGALSDSQSQHCHKQSDHSGSWYTVFSFV